MSLSAFQVRKRATYEGVCGRGLIAAAAAAGYRVTEEGMYYVCRAMHIIALRK